MAPALSSASDVRVIVTQCNTHSLSHSCISPSHIHSALSLLHHIVNLAPNIALSKVLLAGDYKDVASSSGVTQSRFLHLRNPVSGVSSAICSTFVALLWLSCDFSWLF